MKFKSDAAIFAASLFCLRLFFAGVRLCFVCFLGDNKSAQHPDDVVQCDQTGEKNDEMKQAPASVITV